MSICFGLLSATLASREQDSATVVGSRKGLPLRLHLFSGTQKAIFLGKDNKFYMAEGGSESKVTEITHGRNPWELGAERKSDLNEVQLSGSNDEAANCRGGRRDGMICLFEILCFKDNCSI